MHRIANLHLTQLYKHHDHNITTPEHSHMLGWSCVQSTAAKLTIPWRYFHRCGCQNKITPARMQEMNNYIWFWRDILLCISV